jgi:hypothetical protein
MSSSPPLIIALVMFEPPHFLLLLQIFYLSFYAGKSFSD